MFLCVFFFLRVYLHQSRRLNRYKKNYTFPIYIYTLMIILVQQCSKCLCVSVYTRARVTLHVICVSSDSRFYQVYNSSYLQGVFKITSKKIINREGTILHDRDLRILYTIII